MMDNPNQSPRNEYIPVSEEQRRFLEEKYKRRSLAPEALLIRPKFRVLHVATIALALGTSSHTTGGPSLHLILRERKGYAADCWELACQLMLGLGGYFALYADFGDKETCFTPVLMGGGGMRLWVMTRHDDGYHQR